MENRCQQSRSQFEPVLTLLSPIEPLTGPFHTVESPKCVLVTSPLSRAPKTPAK